MRTASKYIFTAALAVITLSGCGNEDNAPEISTGKDYPNFSATIDGGLTRATDQAWEQGDEIGISGAGRTNVCHRTAAGDGKFTVKTPGEQIYFQTEAEVTFTAYYPRTELSGGAQTIKADTKNQSSQKNLDFLWAQAKGKKAAPNVAFNFSHMMSKVILTIKPGNGMTYDEAKTATLSLGGFRHTGAFSIADGSVTVDGSAIDKWVFTGGIAPSAFNDAEKTVTYSLLLLPQVHQKALAFLAELPNYNLKTEIDFTSANREKDGASAKNEWVAGRQYNLSLTLHKTDITLDRCVIKPWTEVKGDEIIVD